MTFITDTAYVVQVLPPDGNGTPIPVVLSTDLDSIDGAMSFMRLVLDTDMTLFKPRKRPWGRPEFSELGRMLPRLRRFAALFASGNQFHPFLAFFFAEYRSHRIRRWTDCQLRVDASDDGVQVAKDFDDFIATLRARATEVRLRRRAANWESKLVKNDKRLRQIESQMFARYRRIIAVRVDCHRFSGVLTSEELDEFLRNQSKRQSDFETALQTDAELPQGLAHKVRVPFEVIQQDRVRLFANMKGKPSLFKHLVGYVWRIEFTPAAGYHLHLALFFDGHEVRKHKWLAQQICDYWRDGITRGEGYAHNCNRDWRESDPNCGLGMIDERDTRKRARLMYLLGYLNKVRQQVLVMPYEGCNVFGAGLIKGRRKGHGGRPRVRGIGADHERTPS